MIVVSDLGVSVERHAVLPDAQRELHEATVCRPLHYLFVGSSTPVPRKLQTKLGSWRKRDYRAAWGAETVPESSAVIIGAPQDLAVPVAHDYCKLVLPRPTRSLVQGVSVSATTAAPFTVDLSATLLGIRVSAKISACISSHSLQLLSRAKR
jgi:hypothetical protein